MVLTSALIWTLNITGIEMPIMEKIILYEQYVAFLFYNWLPIANPVVGMWINRPYRDAVKNFICTLIKKNSQITPVQTINQ
jgi:hypothetical protein